MSRVRSYCAIGAILLILAGCGNSPQPSHPALSSSHRFEVGDPCPIGGAHPRFTLTCFADGSSVGWPLQPGKPAIINLWASWCKPCREELPVIERYYRSHLGSVTVLGVNTADSGTAVTAYLQQLGVKFPHVHDPDRRILGELGISALPITLLVSVDGTIAYKYAGPTLTDSKLGELAARYLETR